MGMKRYGFYKKNNFIINNININDILDKELDLSPLNISCKEIIDKHNEMMKDENFVKANTKSKKNSTKLKLTRIDDFQEGKGKGKGNKNIMSDGFAFLSSDSE